MMVELAAVDAPILGPTRGKGLGLGDPPLSPFGKFSPAVGEPSQDNFVLELEGAPPTAVAFSPSNSCCVQLFFKFGCDSNNPKPASQPWRGMY
jgi:hypothetical protein